MATGTGSSTATNRRPGTAARAANRAPRATGAPRATSAPRASGKQAASPITAAELAHFSQDELDDLFATSPAGPTPAGVADGTAIVAPGTPVAAGLQPLLHFAWRGKVFYPERGDLLNRITPVGVLFARAQVYRDASWVDGGEAIILDYSMAGLPFRAVRDEIREVASGLYLGVVFWVGTKTINFSLAFR